MSKIKTTCEGCGNSFEKERREYNRTVRNGSRHFCGHACAASVVTRERIARGDKVGNTTGLIAGNRKDDFSPFRYHARKARARNKNYNFEETDITPEYLKEIWEQQKGVCPLTGWQMDLPATSLGWERGAMVTPHTASLDRITPRKPYKKGNVRFIANIANMAKHTYTDEDVIEFCKAVAQTRA